MSHSPRTLFRGQSSRYPADAVNYLFNMLYIGQQARSADDWDLADTAAKHLLVFDPSYAGGHYIAAIVAEHEGDSASVRKELTAAERLWGQADPELSEIIDVRKKLVSMRGATALTPTLQ